MGTPSSARFFNVFLDSDGPVAEFDKSLAESGLHAEEFKMLPGIYLWLDITPGAETAIETLKALDDAGLIRVWILTKTPSNSPYAYTEKVLWYRKKFPWLEDRVIITHDKHLMGGPGDYLLDDRPHKANADKFKGNFVYFDPMLPRTCWEDFIVLICKDLEARGVEHG
jgi:5'(3')-deoxyribonucleotidase